MRRAIAHAVAEANLLHFHGIDFADYLPTDGTPTLVTLHLPAAYGVDRRGGRRGG